MPASLYACSKESLMACRSRDLGLQIVPAPLGFSQLYKGLKEVFDIKHSGPQAQMPLREAAHKSHPAAVQPR